MTRRKRIIGLTLPMLIGGIYSCSSSDSGGSSIENVGGAGGGGTQIGGSCETNAECASGICSGNICVPPPSSGSACTTDADCTSGVCTNGTCQGNGIGAPQGSPCSTNTDCASGVCTNGICEGGTSLPDGTSCTSASECASGVCTNGVCGSGTSGGTGGTGGTGGSSTNLPGGSVCAANTQCASGLCLGGYCASGAPGGAACTAGSDCASGICESGVCVGNGQGAPAGSACTVNTDCASAICTNGVCASGAGLPDGASCASNTECSSLSCVNGICTTVLNTLPDGSACTVGSNCLSGLCVSGVCTTPTGGSGGSGTITTGPQWDGSGSAYRPLTAGCGPDTATECTGTCEQSGGDPDVTVIRPPATLCFASPDDPTPEDPAVVIEQSVEELNGVTYVHLRITFDPSFVDNVYGTDSNRSDSGWQQKGGIHIYNHTFNPDLVKSDHTELLITDGTGMTVMNFNLDYISAVPVSTDYPCGYASLGATGGDGLVTLGDPSYILAATTSLTRNLNGCGYCTSEACAPSGDCTIDSPTTDANYTPNPLTPNWDYRQLYEVWIDASAFGDTGFGQAYMTYVHASPNKSTLVSLNVSPSPCPPTWDEPYCPPSVIAEGGNCFGTPTGGTGGTGGADGGGTAGGGTGGSGGTTSECPVNYQIWISTEGQSICTPIPFANYPGMTACPTGYVLDLASEGQYCIPA